MNSNNVSYMISPDSVNEGIAVFRYSDEQTYNAYLEYANAALCSLLHIDLGQLKDESRIS